jgi:RND superfamily putative drug exporter
MESEPKISWLAKIPSGRWSKWLVLVFWLGIMVAAGPLAGKLMGAESNDVSSWLPAKAESTEALKVTDQFQSPHELPAVVVYHRPSGLTKADFAKIKADTADFKNIPHVTGKIIGPIPSRDHQAAQVLVVADLGSDAWANAAPLNDKLLVIARSNANGLSAYVAGQVGAAAAQSKAFNGIDTTLLFSALIVVTVLLLITYRSPVLWLLPVITAAISLTAAQAIIYLLAKHAGLTVNGQSAGILTVLVFGAATDYALLLVSRYREELHRHADRHTAMAIALTRAGPAIIASALTVALGMLCLLAAELNSTKGLGPVAAIGILTGLLAVITLLPALLVIFGRWMFWPRRPIQGTESPLHHSIWGKIGRGIAAHPRRVWIITTLVLLAMSAGLLDLNVTTLQGKDAFRQKPDYINGQEILTAHFPGAGAGEPVIIVGNSDQALNMSEQLKSVRGLTSVSEPVEKDGHVLIQATLTTDPATQASFDTIDRVRSNMHAIPGAGAKVGGFTAITLDTERASTRDQEVVIPLVLLVVFIILALLLHALAAPFMLILTVVLSFAAALGFSAVIFDKFFHFAGTDSAFPLFVFIFLVALGIDYNIFLMTRVREEAIKKHSTKQGVLIALAATGAVITSAGLVLAGTFAVLATLPLTFFTEMGFAVAFGVLLDTIIVRSVLVTALTLDLGHRIWWPSALSRTLSAAPAGAPASLPAQPPPSPLPPPPTATALRSPEPPPPPRPPGRGISGDIRPRRRD